MWLGSLAICGVVLLYVFSGGMRGTAWANAFQTMIFMVLGIVTFMVISDKLGGAQAASQAVEPRRKAEEIRQGLQSPRPKAVAPGKRDAAGPEPLQVAPDVDDGNPLVRGGGEVDDIGRNRPAPPGGEEALKSIKY